jgi:hypothetical protein
MPFRRPRSRSADRGQILVIVAGGMIGLLAIAALALEGGTMLLNRRDGQNAADLSSVAGARIVALSYTQPSDPGNNAQDDVYGAIETNLDQNNCGVTASSPCTWTAVFVGAPATGAGLVDKGPVTDSATALPAGSLGVRVNVTRSPGAIIGRALGFDHWTVSTEATAISQKATGSLTGTLLPIAVCGWSNATSTDCVQASGGPSNAVDFQVGQIYDLTDGKDAPGGFGWVSWDGSNSAGALADSLCTPNNPGFSLDSPFDSPGSYGGVIGTNPATGETWFPIDPGKTNASAVRACLDKWINSGATILVPIYDLVVGPGSNAAYHITGVAAFVLTSREQPAVDNIQGYFVEYYPLGGVPGGATAQPPIAGDTTFFLGLVK